MERNKEIVEIALDEDFPNDDEKRLEDSLYRFKNGLVSPSNEQNFLEYLEEEE